MSVPVSPAPTLVCFAVSQEAKPFQKIVRGRNDVHVLLTGMGARNAERAIRQALCTVQPRRVFSCGFAGALNPDLKIGDVVFANGASLKIVERLQSRGAQAMVFTCTERAAVTVAEKSSLRARTRADVVEMESAVIKGVCREAGIECVTVRAISDTAQENLPLDFNALMTPEEKLSPAKLALAILKAPQKIPALVRLGKNSAFAAKQLADVLAALI
jgi:adenosylhomocysteine nucleosidase